MMKGKQYPLSNMYMINFTLSNNQMTEFQIPDEYFAGSVYEWKSKVTLVDYHNTSCWRPTQYGWLKAIRKHFFTSLPGLSSDLVQKIELRNNQPSSGIFNNLVNAYNWRRKRNYIQNQKQTQNQNQINFPHPHTHKAPILSPSRQWIWQEKSTLIKQEGFLSHPEKAKNLYWWPTIMIQTPFMQNLWKREWDLNWIQHIIKFTAYWPTEVWNLAYTLWATNVPLCSKLLWDKSMRSFSESLPTSISETQQNGLSGILSSTPLTV